MTHTVVTGLRYCYYAPVLHWFCDRIDCGSWQVKREPVNLVKEDYDISLCQQIAVTAMQSTHYNVLHCLEH